MDCVGAIRDHTFFAADASKVNEYVNNMLCACKFVQGLRGFLCVSVFRRVQSSPTLSPDGHGVRRELWLLAGAEEAFAGEAPECRPEVDAVEGVDEGINGAIEPTQPGEGLGQHLAGLVFGQERGDQIVDKEGQPAGDKATHHNAQGLSGLVLLLQRRNPIGQRFTVGVGTGVPAGRCRGYARLVMIMRMVVMASQSLAVPLPMRMPKAVCSRWLR